MTRNNAHADEAGLAAPEPPRHAPPPPPPREPPPEPRRWVVSFTDVDRPEQTVLATSVRTHDDDYVFREGEAVIARIPRAGVRALRVS